CARRSTANKDASLLHDIYLYRFSDKETIRLSKGLRAESVDVSPDGKLFVLTINEAGRRDLAIAATPELTKKRIATIEVEDVLMRLPSLPHEQYYLPRWSPDGTRVAVSRHREEGRCVRIFMYDSATHLLTLEREFSGNGAELRDPSWSADGRSLHVSYDESGIANIYSLDVESGELTRLTCVLGSAFYPEMRGNALAFSEFCENGFRICTLQDAQPIRIPTSSLDGGEGSDYLASIPNSDFSFEAKSYEAAPYKPTFESLYWFPRIAFDYGTFKPGAYLMLNDVLDKLTFIGGAAVNSDREYDLYGLAEYHAFYPTIFAEYFNIQRRLSSFFPDSTRIIGEEERNGLLYPLFDQYRIRFRYNLNEVSVGLGIPLSATSNLKTRGTYDQYVAHNRFDDESSVSLSYFKGWSWKTGYYFDKRRPGLLTDISPSSGYRGFLEYTRANHKFIKDIEIGGDAIGLREIYDPNNYGLIEGGIEKYFASPIKSHSMELRLRGGFIDDVVDPFFYQYAGGLPGMRGYSFYSLGGTRTAVGSLAYRFPIVKRTATSLWPLSLNRVYGSLFSDVGDAWVGDYEDRTPKTDIGAGLRLQMHSFYAYPTALSFDVAYGLDEFSVVEDGVTTGYGHELRYYLTILFDFYTPIIPPARHPATCKCPGCTSRN
ncbi:PD40 domain-containing protein, partial [bacterium]|nr:PD40 domain-containing protein [bacterium]